MEELADRKVPRKQRTSLIQDTEERHLVHSGLEETMITAFNEIVEARNRAKLGADMRTAAYICALQKVGRSYMDLGIFP